MSRDQFIDRMADELWAIAEEGELAGQDPITRIKVRVMYDPSVEWQRDMSWDEIAAAVGVEAPLLAPGDWALDSEVTMELYWPRVPAEIDNEESRRDGQAEALS